MGKFITWLTSVWSVILIISILLFVFWGGPVFSAEAPGHSGRLIVSYSFIPLAVAAVLIWRKKWEWATFVYYTIGIALIKMVITMGVFVGASPRRASGVAKPIDKIIGSAGQEGSYRPVSSDRWGALRGQVLADSCARQLVAVITNINAGKAIRHQMHTIAIADNAASPRLLAVTVGDSLTVTNNDGTLHTFSVTGEGGALLQLPLAPGKSSPAQLITRQGVFSSHCAQGHADETSQLAVFAHPYHTAVGSDGVFGLDSIPPGLYQLAVYDLKAVTTLSIGGAIGKADFTIAAIETSAVELNLKKVSDADSAR